jgi:putative addiction module component (TIGR02574 family)
MDYVTALSAIRSWNVEDRIRLVEEIKDEILADAEHSDLTPAQLQELKRRLDDDDANPDDVIPWEVIKAEAQLRLRQ